MFKDSGTPPVKQQAQPAPAGDFKYEATFTEVKNGGRVCLPPRRVRCSMESGLIAGTVRT